MEAREREVKLLTEVPTSSHCLPTEIRPSSLNRARAHTSRVHARSPMRLDLFLSLSLSSLFFLLLSPLHGTGSMGNTSSFLSYVPSWTPRLGSVARLTSASGLLSRQLSQQIAAVFRDSAIGIYLLH